MFIPITQEEHLGHETVYCDNVGFITAVPNTDRQTDTHILTRIPVNTLTHTRTHTQQRWVKLLSQIILYKIYIITYYYANKGKIIIVINDDDTQSQLNFILILLQHTSLKTHILCDKLSLYGHQHVSHTVRHISEAAYTERLTSTYITTHPSSAQQGWDQEAPRSGYLSSLTVGVAVSRRCVFVYWCDIRVRLGSAVQL